MSIDPEPSSPSRGAAPRFPEPVRLACWIVLVWMTTIGVAGCGGKRWRRENVFASSGLYLYLEWMEKEGARVPMRYEHPIEVSPEKLVVILSRLSYRKDALFRDPEDAFVFEPDQVEVAALAISTALESLSTDQRLRFLVVTSSFASILTGIQGTSGVIFSTNEGTLDLAFDRVHAGMADADEAYPTRFSFPYEPTEFDDLSPLRLDVPGVTHHVDAVSGVEYPRWLEIELARIEAPRAPEPPAEPSPNVAPVARETLPSPDASSGEPERAREGASSTAAGTTSPAAPPGEADAVEDSRGEYDQLKKALDLLERLRAEGVVSEEEYAERRERLLDRALGEQDAPEE